MNEVKPEIICLVGSVKQEEDWRRWVSLLTSQGYIVLEAGLYGTVGKSIPKSTWDLVGRVHFKKIEMCHVVGVIRKRDGTVGQDTQEDIRFAREHGKMVARVESIAYRGVFNDW